MLKDDEVLGCIWGVQIAALVIWLYVQGC